MGKRLDEITSNFPPGFGHSSFQDSPNGMVEWSELGNSDGVKPDLPGAISSLFLSSPGGCSSFSIRFWEAEVGCTVIFNILKFRQKAHLEPVFELGAETPEPSHSPQGFCLPQLELGGTPRQHLWGTMPRSVGATPRGSHLKVLGKHRLWHNFSPHLQSVTNYWLSLPKCHSNQPGFLCLSALDSWHLL